MKLNFTKIIFTIVAFAFCFSSCKKESIKTTVKNTTTVDLNKAAIQFAVSFYKSVTGAYGGAQLKNGIKISPINSLSKNGAVLLSTNPLCGFEFDTTANYMIHVTDTISYHYGGHYSFTYTCTGNSPDGYHNDNSYFTSYRTTNTLDSLHVIQKYDVKALDNTYKLVSLNGTMETQMAKAVYNGPFYPFYPNLSINTDAIGDYAQYTLNDIKVDVSSGIPDMISGTATFSDYHDVQNKDNTNIDFFHMYYATITFLGNHLARIEVQIAVDFGPPDPKVYVYTVNVITGQVV